ncbi:MAG TPA: amidohydrolase family protein [Bacteroidia bacterium]|nr:amidohydrolase family protein [Bacteroidia bacterium]
MKKNILIAFCILHSAFLISQTPTPAPGQTKSILISGLIIHVGNGKVIENGVIGFKDGKITLVADATTIKMSAGAYDSSYSLNGAHAYPGFIAPNTTLGITETDAVRATNDFNEVGGYNPHIRSLIAYNAEGKVITTVRTNGVLFAQVTPRRGTISGTSSVMALDGWNWEDAVLKKDDGVHVNFPKVTFRAQSNIEGPDVPTTGNTRYDEQVNELKKFFSDAKAYCLTAPEEKNLRYEAMRGVFAGTQNLYIHADFVKDIIASVNFVKQFEIKKPVLIGGNDSWKITKLLKQNNIPVMITRLHSLPETDFDDVDLPYKLAYLLQKDSVMFCLQNAGDQEGQHARNIPFLAGTARAYGLTNEQAVASVSYYTAKILGIDTKTGSLEVGKDASFFISTGDALDMMTNNVILAFINGKKLMLTNTQQEQYQRFCKKYGIKP